MDSKLARKQAGSPVEAHVSTVEHVYNELKRMAVRFELLPDTRLNEVELAASLGISRTPLREALNRLTSDGFLKFVPGKGFFRHPLDVKEIFDLYEMRQTLEMGAARLAVARATDDRIKLLKSFVAESARERPDSSLDDLIGLDETFHEELAKLSGNDEILQTLRRINERIRFVRWINMENGRRRYTQAEHLDIIDAVAARDADRVCALLQQHIDGRLEQITLAVREGYAHIYTARGRRS